MYRRTDVNRHHRLVVAQEIGYSSRMDTDELPWEHVSTVAHVWATLAEPYHNKIAKALNAFDTAVYDLETGQVSAADYLFQKVPGLHRTKSITSKAAIEIKAAETPVISVAKPLGQAFNLLPSSLNAPIGGPTPLAAALTGGLLTAGGGYLAGRLAENLLPERIINGKNLRRTGLALGGLLGAVPGLYLGSLGMRTRPNNATSSPWNAWIEQNPLVTQPIQKSGNLSAGPELLPIEVDGFNRLVMRDPYLPPQIQTATVGLMESANTLAGSNGIVTPTDLASLAIGMGAGMAQAYLGGKVLGALAGLTPEAQKGLQNVGAVAGALKMVIPGMFGAP